MPRLVRDRSEIPVKHTWDASSVFASDTAWEAEIVQVYEKLPHLSRFRGRLVEGPETLLNFLTISEQLLHSVGKINVYATMLYAVDTTDQVAVARRDRAQSLYARVVSAMAFSEPELLAIGAEKLHEWMSIEPRLATYDHSFDRLEQRCAHTRSVEVEEVLHQTSEPFNAAVAIHSVLANADLRFIPAHDSTGETYEISQGTIDALLAHSDRTVRRTAWENYADAHLALKNTMASCLATGVKQNVFTARARGYASALEAALDADFLPSEVFHNLIAAFRNHLPIWHRYWRVRRQALGYDELYPYDIKAPLTSMPTLAPYHRAIEWICEGLQPLGDEYVSVMRRGLIEQRWVDVYPNRGKRAGAFSMGIQGTHPFIMMNYNNDIFGLSTLAHELGHSMHSYYTRANQPFVYANYGLFAAEVASNLNQALVRSHLLAQAEEHDFHIALIEEAMANFHRYFFIMPTLARFELEIHQRVERGQPLSADTLIAIMADLFAEGYGDEVIMDRERVGMTWGEFSTHLYSNFYAYKYATGISGAHALAEGILAGNPGAVKRYLDFLKAGSSQYPLDILKHAGVDLTSPEPIEQTFGVLENFVDRLEKLTTAVRRASNTTLL